MSAVSMQKKSPRQRTAVSPEPVVRAQAAARSPVKTTPADTGAVTEKVFWVKQDGYVFESKILSVVFLFVAIVAWMAILVFIDDAFDAEKPRPFGSRADCYFTDNIYAKTFLSAVLLFANGQKLYEKRHEQTTAGRMAYIFVLFPFIVVVVFIRQAAWRKKIEDEMRRSRFYCSAPNSFYA